MLHTAALKSSVTSPVSHQLISEERKSWLMRPVSGVTPTKKMTTSEGAINCRTLPYTWHLAALSCRMYSEGMQFLAEFKTNAKSFCIRPVISGAFLLQNCEAGRIKALALLATTRCFFPSLWMVFL